MARFERRFDQVERERQLVAKGLQPPLLAELDVTDRQDRHHDCGTDPEPDVVEEQIAAEQSGREHQHDDQQHVGNPHVHAGLPHHLFQLAQEVQVVEESEQRPLLGTPPADDLDFDIIGGTGQAPCHLALLLDLRSAAVGNDQHADEDDREYAACQYKIHSSLSECRVAGEKFTVQLVARGLQPLRIGRPDSGCNELAQHFAAGSDSRALEFEQILHHHHLAFHAADLRDTQQFARTVGQTRDVNNDVECRRYLLAHRALRNLHARQQHHHLEAAHAVARGVGVDGRDGSVMTGRHRLQHVEHFAAADLADDYAVGPHKQGVLHQVALADFALAFDVGRPRFEPDHVRLLQHQFGRVLDRHDSFVGRDEQRHAVKHGRFARAGAAAHEDVEAGAHDGSQEIDDLGYQRLLLDQVVDVVALAAESTNRERRSVERERRYNRVDTRTVGQARVNHRRRLVDPASDLRHNSIDDQHQVLIVLELDVGRVQLAALFDVHLVVAVDQDIGDLIVPQQRLQRSETQQLVLDLFDQVILVGISEQPAFIVEDGGDGLGHFLRRQHGLEALEPRDVQRLEQPVVDGQLQLLKAFGLRIFDRTLRAAAHERALKRCGRRGVLLRNSLNQLHSGTSTARADNVQQARDQ